MSIPCTEVLTQLDTFLENISVLENTNVMDVINDKVK